MGHTTKVTPPAGGLVGASNYFIASDCNPIVDLSVDVVVTADLVSRTAELQPQGFSFQVNAYAPPDVTRSVWQQFILSVDTYNLEPAPLKGLEIALTGFVEVWPNHLPNGSDLYQGRTPSLLGMATTTLPAGTHMNLALQNDKQKRIVGATFTLVDSAGGVVQRQSLVFKSLDRDSSLSNTPTTPGYAPGRVDDKDLSAINAFQLNLVGPTFLSGAGKITYSAKSPLSVLPAQPTCTAAQGVFTGENSNATYGEMLPGPSQTLEQTFAIP